MPGVDAAITPAPSPDGSSPVKRVPAMPGMIEEVVSMDKFLHGLSWINDIDTVKLESSALNSKAASISEYLADRTLVTLSYEVTAKGGLHLIMMQNASTNHIPASGSGTLSSLPKVTPFLCMTTASSTVTVAASSPHVTAFSGAGLRLSATRHASAPAAPAAPAHAMQSPPPRPSGPIGKVITTTIGGVPVPFVQTLPDSDSQPTTAASSVAGSSSEGPVTTFAAQLRARNVTEAPQTTSTTSAIPCHFDSLNDNFMAKDIKGNYVVLVRAVNGSLVGPYSNHTVRRGFGPWGNLQSVVGDLFHLIG